MPLKTNPLSGEASAGRVYAGRGISIAILDTGISPTEDFILPENRIVAFRDLVNGKRRPYDDNGHGTHVTVAKANFHGAGKIRQGRQIFRKNQNDTESVYSNSIFLLQQ